MDHILGQDRAIDILQAALRSGRVHHALVFHGPAGVGKFTTARALARVLLCHDAQPDLAGRIDACGNCVSCQLLPAKAPPQGEPGPVHPDMVVVTKELARYSDNAQIRTRKLLNIPSEVLEEFFLQPAHRAPQVGRCKALIIDEAELLDAVGQNKLLKTLEEPPAGMYLILVTSSEDRLLPTIRSRCHRIAFTPLDARAFDAWLGARGAELGAGQRQWLLDFAAGSPGRAALALEHGLLAWSEAVLPALDALRAGKSQPRLGATISQCINGFAEKWVDTHPNGSKEAANKLAAGLMWSMIAQHARGQMAKASATLAPGDTDAALGALEPWLGVIEAVGAAQAQLGSNLNMSLVCDHLLLALQRSLAAA